MKSSLLVVFLASSLPWGGGDARAQQPGCDQAAEIVSVAEFERLSVPSVNPASHVERSTKFLLPVDGADPSLLPLVFQNANEHLLHLDFLVRCVPRFAALGFEEYGALVERRATRGYFAGVLSRIRPPDSEAFYGFHLVAGDDPEDLPTQEEVHDAFARLDAAFVPGPLRYAPASEAAREAARAWGPDPGFEVYLEETAAADADYVPYTLASGFGWVRILSADEFERANEEGLLVWQDILVLEQAPRDIEGVVAGVITAEPQGELSHVAIRTARRNTPNAFVRGALEAFAPFAGKLVELTVTRAAHSVREVADAGQAEAFWAANRPQISDLPPFDAEYAALDSFAEMDLDDAPESRYGGKASNLARLQRFIEPRFGEVGFAIPMRYYLEFLRENTLVVDGRTLTFEEYLDQMLADPGFQADPAVRAAQLDLFRASLRAFGWVSPALLERVIERVREVFGGDTRMVRFRSSSNIEDALEFNGAGLYESTSGCVADTLDADGGGPSLCDPTNPDERTIERALKRVWSSLWTFRAFEERSWYRIPQKSAAMGILVNRAFLDEHANGVAFTGNPANPFDRRYIVVVQLGEEASVVSPEPGVVSEKNVLEVDPATGELLAVERAQRSSLAADGEWVLSDERLAELAAVLWRIDREFPLELGGHAREEVVLDIEFKLEADGTLAFKQVRPFLTNASGPPPPTFALEVPEGTEVCGVWVDGRPAADAYRLKSRVALRAGRLELPAASTSFTAELIERVEVGAELAEARPLEPGRVSLVRRPGAVAGSESFTFTFRQPFDVEGRALVLEIEGLRFVTLDGVVEEATLRLDEERLTWALDFVGELGNGAPPAELIRYGSCTHASLPLHGVSAELEGGHRIELEERYQAVEVGSAPAAFTGATVTIGGEDRRVEGYRHLVYSAFRHNEKVRAWVLLEPPVRLGADTVRAVQLDLEDFHRRPPLYTAAAAFLGEDLAVLRELDVVRYCRAAAGERCAGDFRRGDADGDGRVALNDPVVLLGSLFLGQGDVPCPDGADFDDIDGVQLNDAVLALTFLFRGVDLSAPPGPHVCGPDPTPDALEPCTTTGCP